MRTGITIEESHEQRRRRKRAVALIEGAGEVLNLPDAAMLTAAGYACRVLVQPLADVSSLRLHCLVEACIYLACKVEECPRRVSDIVNIVRRIRRPRAGDPPTAAAAAYPPDPSGDDGADVIAGDEYYAAKEAVLSAEQTVLRALGYDLVRPPPHKYLYNILHALRASPALAAAAAAALRDALLRTTLALQFAPAEMAAGAVHLAALLLGVAQALPRAGGACWWDALGLELAALEAVGNGILDIYTADKEQPLTADDAVLDTRRGGGAQLQSAQQLEAAGGELTQNYGSGQADGHAATEQGNREQMAPQS